MPQAFYNNLGLSLVLPSDGKAMITSVPFNTDIGRCAEIDIYDSFEIQADIRYINLHVMRGKMYIFHRAVLEWAVSQNFGIELMEDGTMKTSELSVAEANKLVVYAIDHGFLTFPKMLIEFQAEV